MTNILYKGYIGKDDFNLNGNELSPTTDFTRKASLGTSSMLPTPNFYMTHYGIVNPRYWGDHSCSQTNLNYAIAHIGSNARTLHLEPGTWSITASLTIPSNITLLIDGGAAITPASGVTLTIAGKVLAPAKQIFYGDGTVTVSSYPQDQAWWGNAQRLDLTGLSVGGVIVTGAGVTPASTNITMTASSRVIGRKSSGGGLSEELSITDVLNMLSGAADGYVPTRQSGTWVAKAGGKLVQVVNYATGAEASGTTAILDDDTIPQNTEGDEYLTVSITPKSAGNYLLIFVNIFFSNGVLRMCGMALFQDATANALAATGMHVDTNGYTRNMSLIHYMQAGTSNPTTFKVRAGNNGVGTFRLNSTIPGRLFGGVASSSITVVEIAA